MRCSFASVLNFTCLLLAVSASVLPGFSAIPTPAPHGPFHVAGATLVDAEGHPFLIRGTQTTPFRLRTAETDARSGSDFGPHSATSFSAIRLRFNMNAVRVAADISEADRPGYFEKLKELVSSINESDLLVVLAASDPGSPMPREKTLAFWRRCGAAFQSSPNVLFDAFDAPEAAGVLASGGDPHTSTGWDYWQRGDGGNVAGMQDVIRAIRSAGARQPIVLDSWNDGKLFEGFDPARLKNETDILYEVSPRYEDRRDDAVRDRQFGFVAAQAPLIANDWDLHLDQAAACRAAPADPEGASKLVLDNIAYFDSHKIAWTVSSYEVGRLLEDNVNLIPTKLEGGITCGAQTHAPTGMGRLILSRMFGTDEGKLIVVNVSGGAILPRGGYSIAYGRIMAQKDAAGSPTLPPYRLGEMSAEITDSKGVTLPARMNWASAGWGSLNFIVPSESALGVGRLTLKRADGTHDEAAIDIEDTAPGLFTLLNCQGPAVGMFTQSSPRGRIAASGAISRCKGYDCSTLPIPVANGAITRVKLVGNGFRNVTSASQIEVTIAGVRVPVVSYKPAHNPGVDELIIEIPAVLKGTGEADLVCHVNRVVANVVRVSIGGSRASS